MVRTPRFSEEAAGLTGDESQSGDIAEAKQILQHALRTYAAAKDQRVRAEAVQHSVEEQLKWYVNLTEEISLERQYLDRAITIIDKNDPHFDRFPADLLSRIQKLPMPTPPRSLLGSLQFVAGSALAGAVVTGILLGHDIHGVDPTYFGALAGLLAGFSTWAVRGL